MHMMMMDTHQNHEDHQSMTITKEITKGENTILLSIPPMRVGREDTISITLHSILAMPESVTVHYMVSKKSSMEHIQQHDHGKQTDTNEVFESIHQNIFLNHETSTFVYRPTIAGNFLLTAVIEKIPNSDSSFTVETNFIVQPKEDHTMISMGSTWDYPLIGVIVMGTMMVGMWVIRSGL